MTSFNVPRNTSMTSFLRLRITSLFYTRGIEALHIDQNQSNKMDPKPSMSDQIGDKLSKIKDGINALNCITCHNEPTAREQRRQSEILAQNPCFAAGDMKPTITTETGKFFGSWIPFRKKRLEAKWADKTVQITVAQEDSTAQNETPSGVSSTSFRTSAISSSSEYYSDEDEASPRFLIWDTYLFGGLGQGASGQMVKQYYESMKYLPNYPRGFESRPEVKLDPGLFWSRPISPESDMVLEEFDSDSEWCEDSEHGSDNDPEEEEEEEKKGMKGIWRRIKSFFSRRHF